MGNSNEEPKKVPVIKTEQNTPAAPKNNLLLLWGAFIIALSALGIALYTCSLNQQLQNQLLDKNQQLSAQVDKLAEKQDKTEDQITVKTQKIEETRDALQAKFAELNKQMQNALSQRFYQSQNWLLLKTRYYLELAQINAHWSKDFSATIAMLQQADQLMQQSNDPGIFDIRQAIAKDIAHLQAQPKVDIAGILSQLDAAQTSLNDLNIRSSLSDNKPQVTEKPITSTGTPSVWHLHLQDSMSLLSKLVVIRHNDEKIKPIISPEFEAILKENIRLNLQEAQWAVLNNNMQVYQLVLQQAITSLKKNFSESANTAALIKKLDELKQIQLTPARNEVNSALPLLNQLIDTKESETTQSNTEKQKGDVP